MISIPCSPFLVSVLRFSANKKDRIANYIDIILLIDHFHNAFYGTARVFCIKNSGKMYIHTKIAYTFSKRLCSRFGPDFDDKIDDTLAEKE